MADNAAALEVDRPAPLERLLRRIIAVGALTMLGYLALVIAGDTGTIREGLRSLGPGQWLLLLGLSLLNYGLRFLRWHAYLRALGASVPVGRDLLIYVGGFAFTVTPGKVGETVRSVYLRSAGVPWSAGLAAFGVERILDVAAALILSAGVLRMAVDQGLAGLLLIALVVLGLLLLTRTRALHRLLGWLPRTGRRGRLAREAVAILDDARVLLGLKPLSGGLLLGLAAWAAEAWGFYLLLTWLGVSVEPTVAMGIYAAAALAGALVFLPGGLGGTEATMIALSVASGAGLGSAVLATLICRAVTLWLSVLLGILAVLALRRR